MKIKCFLGFHKPDGNWILKFSSKFITVSVHVVVNT